LYELYKIYVELSMTIGFCILFIFLHITISSYESQGEITIFIDLSLLPWLIWITKKIVDTAKSYR
jgi:hypothetical protein